MLGMASDLFKGNGAAFTPDRDVFRVGKGKPPCFYRSADEFTAFPGVNKGLPSMECWSAGLCINRDRISRRMKVNCAERDRFRIAGKLLFCKGSRALQKECGRKNRYNEEPETKHLPFYK